MCSNNTFFTVQSLRPFLYEPFMTNTSQDTLTSLAQLTAPLKAMHLAQLTAFAFAIPQLYFCREYLKLDEQSIINQCMQRLQNALTEQTVTLAQLIQLLEQKEYFTAAEVHSRLAPEPDFESLSDE